MSRLLLDAIHNVERYSTAVPTHLEPFHAFVLDIKIPLLANGFSFRNIVADADST